MARVYAALVVAFLLLGGGFWTGYKVRDASCLKALSDAQNAVIESARVASEAQRRRAIAEAEREAVAGRKSTSAYRAGVSHAIANPGCVLSGESRRLFGDAIRAANSEAD